MFKSEIEGATVMCCMCAWAAGMWFLWVVKNLMTMQSQHVPPGGQPLQRHMLTVHSQKTPFKKGFWYSLYQWDVLHIPMRHHMYYSHIWMHIYIHTHTVWNLLNPELNVPSPADAISAVPVLSIIQLKRITTQGQSARNTGKLSHCLCVISSGWKKGNGLQWLRCAKCPKC